MTDRKSWLASLKVGDEVAVGGKFFTVAKRTAKRFVLSDGRKFDAEGIEVGPAWRYEMHARPLMNLASAARRITYHNRLSRALKYLPHFCDLSEETLAKLCAVLDEAAELRAAKEGNRHS